MKTPIAVSTFAVILALPLLSQSTVPPDLQQAMKQRAEALSKADATTWARLTADNFVVVNGAGVLQTKAQRVAMIKAGQPNGPTSVEHESVQMYGNTAVQRFQSTRDGIWVAFVWAKDKNGWRVTYAQVTPIFPDSASVRSAIDANNARFMESMKGGDAAALTSQYANDAVVMLANMPAWQDSAGIHQGFTAMFNGVTVPDVKLTTREVTIDAGTAIERGAYEMTIHPKSGTGPDVVDKGKYLTVWTQLPDGSWKIMYDISNSDNPAAR